MESLLIKRVAAAARLFGVTLAVVCLPFRLAVASAAAGEDLGPAVVLKPGEEVTFDATVADGRIGLGPPHLSRPSAAHPRESEIAVSMFKHGLSPYADIAVEEKTSAPVDFVATGLVGDIKIDEVVICGRLDAPVVARIASGSWRVSLNRFLVHPNGQATTDKGDLGCPK